MILFHGSSDAIRELDYSKQDFLYLTDMYAQAMNFACQSVNGIGTICTINVQLERPYEIDLDGQSWGGFFLESADYAKAVEMAADGNEEELKYFREEGLTVNYFAEYISTIGYDGLICHNCMEENGDTAMQVVVVDISKAKMISSEEVTKSK